MISRRGYTCDLAAGQGTSSIKSVRILPEASSRGIHEQGGQSSRRRRGGKEKERERGKYSN